MVLVVLAVVWLIILVPPALRRYHRGGGDSISHFHRQLRILQRSGPNAPPPAYRLQSVPSSGLATINGVPSSVAPVLTVVGSGDMPRPALAYLAEQPPYVAAADSRVSSEMSEEDRRKALREAQSFLAPSSQESSGSYESYRPPDPYARQLACKRRRDTLMVLVLTFACSLFVGIIPAVRLVWVVTAISGVIMVAYVALLVHLRSMAAERERKLRYLRPQEEYGALSGYQDASYGHPAERSAAAR